MNIAAVTALLEAECVKSGKPWSPKFPGEPTVNTTSMGEVLRAVIAIKTRSNRLEKASASLKKAEAALNKKPTKSNEVKVACAKLAVDAAKQWLAFTNKRYQMLKDLLDETGTAKTKAKMANVMAWAAPFAAAGLAHLDNMEGGHLKDDADQPGPWPDVQFPYSGPNKFKFVTSSGEPFVVPDSTGTGAVPDLPTPEVEPEEPIKATPDDYTGVPQKMKSVADLSAAEKAKLKAALKTAILANAAKGEDMLGHDYAAIWEDAGVSSDNTFLDDVFNDLYATSIAKTQLTAKLAESALTSGKTGVEASDAVFVEAAKQGHLLGAAAIESALMAAEDQLKKPKAWDELTSAEQNKAKAKFKEEFFAQPAGTGPMSVVGSVQMQLAGQGLNLSGAAMTAIAGQFATLSLKEHSGLGALPAGAAQAATEIAKKMSAGQDIKKLVKDAGVAVLSDKAAKELLASVGKTPTPPDDAGFLTEFTKLVKSVPLSILGAGPVHIINQHHPMKWLGLLSHHHIDPSSTNHLDNKLNDIIIAEFKARWKPLEAEAVLVKAWDDKAQFDAEALALKPTAPAYIGVGQNALYDAATQVGIAPPVMFTTVVGKKLGTFVLEVFKDWLAAWEKKQPKAEPSAEPKQAEPEATGATPTLALVGAPLPEMKQPLSTEFKKISKEKHLTPEQKKVIQALIAQAMESKLHLTKAGKVKKQLGAVAGVIQGDFKALYEPAGVSGIGKKLVTAMLEDAIKNPPKPPTAAPAPAPATGAAPLSLFGMNSADMMAFVEGGPLPTTVMAPPFGSWGGTKLIGDKGGHGGKMFADASASGDTTAAQKTHTFMFKHDGYRARGEIAAVRLQAILGLGGPGENAYITKKGSKEGIVQFFEAKPNLRTQYGKGGSPWSGSGAQGPKKQKIVHSLQLAAIGGWIMGEKDDHGGNFVEAADGMFHGIDHGQACKYFDSSYDLVKDWDWKADPNWPGGYLEDDKGWPKRMLRDWASGADVPIMPLTHPSVEEVVRRAEEIPDEVYAAIWRPYAEGAAKAKRLARYSTVASDKTVEGFLSAMQDRRKNLRAQVANLYAMLARTRAESIKKAGDPRSVKEITDEIKEQIGLDNFAMGKAKAQTASQSVLDSLEPADSPGWDEAKLDHSSHLPSTQDLQKWGVKGWDVAVGGDSIKDGRITMRQLGEVPMASFMLDNPARAALQARLPGYASSTPPPPKPGDFIEPPFVPPSKPTYETVSDDKLFDDILGGGEDFTGVAKPDGRKVTKVEKYIRKWKKGELKLPSAANYMVKALKRARDAKASPDPLIAAAGAHYEKELLRFGDESPSASGGFAFKSVADVPADQQEIAPFTAPADMAEKQKEAKAAGEAAYQEALDKAKEAHKQVVAQAKDEHDAKMAQYEAQYDMWKAGSSGQGDMIQNAKMYNGARMPVGVKQKAREDGTASNGSTWDGKWDKMWYSGAGKSFEIDLTDAVTALAGVSTGSGADSKFVIRYNTGSTNQQDAKNGNISGKVAACEGQCYVQFPKGSTKEQQRVMLQHAFKVLGLDARPADRVDHELNYARKMAWLLGAEGAFVKGDDGKLMSDGRWHAVEPADGSRKDRIAFWMERLKKKLGYDPRYAPELDDKGRPKVVGGKVVMQKDANGNPVPNPHYKPVASRKGSKIRHRRPDMTDAELEHRMKTGTAPVMIQQSKPTMPKILQGTMMSTTERTINGVMKPHGGIGGASAGSDAASGGAGGVFVYNRQTGNMKARGSAAGGPTRMIFHPSMFLGTNHYPRSGDTFGSKVSSGSVASTLKSLEERIILEIHSRGSTRNPESIVSDQIDIFEHVLFYVADSATQKQEIIDKLTAAGITEIGMPKRPVKDVIVASLPTKAKVDKLLKDTAESDEWRF